MGFQSCSVNTQGSEEVLQEPPGGEEGSWRGGGGSAPNPYSQTLFAEQIQENPSYFSYLYYKSLNYII